MCRLHRSGQLKVPLELVLCINETPVNSGDWCVAGPQPVWTATSNEYASVIPFVHWVQRPDRDTDLSHWNPETATPDSWDFAFGNNEYLRRGDARNISCAPKHAHDIDRRACAAFCREGNALQHCTWCKCAGCDFCYSHSWQHKEPVAVFRGGAHRLNVHSESWRESGPRRSPVTAANWHAVGRTAMIAQRASAGKLLNVNLTPSGAAGHSDHLQKRLGIPNSSWNQLDSPQSMSFLEQVDRFKYTVNVEGHGGWADRLYKPMLSGQLVMMQDLPARLWYEAPLKPWIHYVPVDSGLKNLSDGVHWAREHDGHAKKMADASREVMLRWLAPGAMFRYTEELLLGYAKLFTHTSALSPRAVRFSCDERLPEVSRTCRVTSSEGNRDSEIDGSVCYFDLPSLRHTNGRKYGSLFEASLDLDADIAGKSASPPGETGTDKERQGHSASVLQVLAGDHAHRQPLARSLWLAGLSRVKQDEFEGMR